MKFVTSPIKQTYSHTKLCSPGFRKSQRSPVVLQIVSFHLLCTSIHPSLLLLHSLFPPFMVKSSHTNEPFLTDISLQVWAVTMCCFFWVGGAGIHACNLSQYWRPFPQELVVNPACLKKVLLLEMNGRVPGFPVGFSFFTKFDLRQNGLVDLCLPLLLKTD